MAHCGDRLPIDEVPFEDLDFLGRFEAPPRCFLAWFRHVWVGLGYERPNYSSKLNRQNSHFI
ncbi:MAG: hypothetical protein ACI8T1_000897 [Verrucomicrobiales bacterium]